MYKSTRDVLEVIGSEPGHHQRLLPTPCLPETGYKMSSNSRIKHDSTMLTFNVLQASRTVCPTYCGRRAELTRVEICSDDISGFDHVTTKHIENWPHTPVSFSPPIFNFARS